MRQRLRQEDGFTLPELLTTMTIGLILVLATLSLVEVTMRRTGETQDRIEALQGGRLAMDTVTRELRSRVCLPRVADVDAPQISIDSASPDSITFFTDMRDTSTGGTPAVQAGYIAGPDKRTLTYVEATGQLIESTYPAYSLTGSVYGYKATPARTRELLTNVQRAQGTVNGATVTIPIFQYFQYDFEKSEAAGEEFPSPSYPITNAADPKGVLTADQSRRIAKVRITFRANAPKRRDGKASTVFTDEVFTRNVDPNAESDELSEPCK
jgi:prepilin-type N-terminal cleavage/methylation domain-containing protein